MSTDPYRTQAPKGNEPVDIELQAGELEEAARLLIRHKYGLDVTKSIIGQEDSALSWAGQSLRITNVRRAGMPPHPVEPEDMRDLFSGGASDLEYTGVMPRDGKLGDIAVFDGTVWIRCARDPNTECYLVGIPKATTMAGDLAVFAAGWKHAVKLPFHDPRVREILRQRRE